MSGQTDIQTVVFFDTMIYVHCVPIQDIDLPALLEVTKVNVIIPRIVIQELDKHKNTHSSQSVRTRVKTRLHDIREWVDSLPCKIRDGVEVSAFPRRPLPECFVNGLDMNWPDDQIIAGILEYRKTYPNHRVVLVSHDTGIQLAARDYDIETTEIPDKWRIAPEEDAIVKENKQLKNELLRIKNERPELLLRLEGMEADDQHIVFEISKPTWSDCVDKATEIDRLKKDYPEMSSPEPNSETTELPNVASIIARLSDGESKADECRHYNRERTAYISRYGVYLDKLKSYHEQVARTIYLHFEVHNIGSSPAEDLDLCMHFPDGFFLCTEDNCPTSQTPSPPPDPRLFPRKSELTRRLMNSQISVNNIGVPSVIHDNFSLRRTNSYELKKHFDRVKHCSSVKITPLCLVFDSFEKAGSFSVSYEMHVANLADPVQGKVHIVVNKSE